MHRLHQKQRIFVLEGPAGSGKTYMANLIQKEYDAIIAQNPWVDRPRGYDSNLGNIMAMTKDVANYAIALQAMPRDAILDRWGLSSFVYFCIRKGLVVPTDEMFSIHLHYMGYLLNVATSGLQNFEEVDLDAHTLPQLIWIINLPQLTTVLSRRQKAGKEYPYSASKEWEMYAWIVDFLKRNTDLRGQWFDHVYIADDESQGLVVDPLPSMIYSGRIK